MTTDETLNRELENLKKQRQEHHDNFHRCDGAVRAIEALIAVSKAAADNEAAAKAAEDKTIAGAVDHN
jgi:hypothetical protein